MFSDSHRFDHHGTLFEAIIVFFMSDGGTEKNDATVQRAGPSFLPTANDNTAQKVKQYE